MTRFSPLALWATTDGPLTGVVLKLATCGTTARSHHVLEEGSPVDLRLFNSKSECVRSHGTILTGQCRLGNREIILADCHQGAVHGRATIASPRQARQPHPAERRAISMERPQPYRGCDRLS